MEGFSYHDIFATKGVEYLVIIAFLTLLVPFSIILNRQLKVTTRIKKAIGVLTAGILKVPQGLLFSRTHTWTHLDKSGTASVGVDDLLMHLTGGVRFSRLKNPGETIRKGEALAVIDHEGKHLRVFSPISGHIVAFNPSVEENPGIVNEDPYGRGWLYKVTPTDWISETSNCFLAEEASAWAGRELDRVKDFLAVTMKRHAPGTPETVLQDGGELRDQTLTQLPDEIWHDFQKEFLTPEGTL